MQKCVSYAISPTSKRTFRTLGLMQQGDHQPTQPPCKPDRMIEPMA